MSISIFYSPQPDEQDETSAACEYANRASEMLSSKGTGVTIQRLSIDSLDPWMNPTNHDADVLLPPSSTLIIVSCSADGSVDRIVRKILREMKSKATQSTSTGTPSTPSVSNTQNSMILVALLGHARCDNSAKMMKDTIFNHGRKFHKCVEASTASAATTTSSSLYGVHDRIEVQVELEGPDAPGGYDEWIHSNFS